MKGVGTDVGEDFVGEVGGADEDDEFADDVVGGDTVVGGFG